MFLYAVLLGGKMRKQHLMEDHYLVFVVAGSEKEARKMAKTKWDAEEVHVDGTQKIEKVDGFKIQLSKEPDENSGFDVNPQYSL